MFFGVRLYCRSRKWNQIGKTSALYHTKKKKKTQWKISRSITVRSDVEERVAEERLAWNDKNIPARPKNVGVCETLANYNMQCVR